MVAIVNTILLRDTVIAAGLRGKTQRRNERVSNQSGFMQTNILWTRSLRRYEFGFVPMIASDWRLLETIFETTAGGAYGFLMEDPTDSAVSIAEGLLQPYTTLNVGTAGFGYGVPAYQLNKRYTATGGATSDRKITRTNGSAVKRGGVAVTVGVGAGNVSINADTGLVTFVADTSEAITSITAGATTVLNFSGGAGIVANVSIGQRVYVAAATGTIGTALNGSSYQITAKGAASLTISAVTTGLTGTGGAAYKYPQTTEALTWSGAFYIPVQFENDDLEFEIVIGGDTQARWIAGPNVALVEVME